IVVQVRGAGAAAVVTVKRPNESDVVWSYGRQPAPDTGIVTSVENGLLQMRCAVSSRNAGAWTVSVSATSGAPPAVKVWAIGGPAIRVREGVPVTCKAPAQAGSRRLVKVTAEPGVSLLTATFAVAPSPATGYGATAETGRPVSAHESSSAAA